MATQKFVNGSTILGLTVIMFGFGFSYPLGSFMSSFMLVATIVWAFLSYKVFMEP